MKKQLAMGIAALLIFIFLVFYCGVRAFSVPAAPVLRVR